MDVSPKTHLMLSVGLCRTCYKKQRQVALWSGVAPAKLGKHYRHIEAALRDGGTHHAWDYIHRHKLAGLVDEESCPESHAH